MSRGGIHGINKILNTGKILSDSILIGADTNLASIMTRIFITGTIVARAVGGRKDSMSEPLKDPNLRDRDLVLLK
jgi:hypothetical protein